MSVHDILRTDPRVQFLVDLFDTAVRSIGTWAMEVDAVERGHSMTIIAWADQTSVEHVLDLPLLAFALRRIAGHPIIGLTDEDRADIVAASNHNDTEGLTREQVSAIVQVGFYGARLFPEEG